MNTTKTILIIFLVLLLLTLGGFAYFKFYKKSDTATNQTTTTGGKTSTLSKTILDNKFGFLSGDPGEYQFITAVGAGWVRPHPGPFLWDSTQNTPNGQYDFTATDKMVTGYQKGNIGILATLWPFAEWDQKTKDGFDKCAVSSNDDFLSKTGMAKRGGEYLPEHRCSPQDWNAYQKWVKAIVERYDGDGKNDMPNLKTPVKYWEVMNEPDLGMENPRPGEEERLKFWKDTPEAYGQLLIKTSEAIKAADEDAQVLIAGAAGGSKFFLDFYRKVLAVSGAKDAFDIGNVHCISNDNYDSFNVEPYKKLLSEFNLNKAIWVTEAEAMVSNNADSNATQTLNSTKKALAEGAAKIFYTRYEFTAKENAPQKPGPSTPIQTEISGQNPQEAYQKIIQSTLNQ